MMLLEVIVARCRASLGSNLFLGITALRYVKGGVNEEQVGDAEEHVHREEVYFIQRLGFFS